MPQHENIRLILLGISHRLGDYLKVKQIQNLPLREIEAQTGFTISFIRKCREVGGWRRGNQ